MAGSRVTLPLILSYVVDWIVIIGIAAVGAAFWKKSPNHRPFSPVDPDISFPYVEQEKVSTTVLVVVSLVAPAILTAVFALIFTPGFGASKGVPKSVILKRKLWEWNTAWMGLALGLATTFLFTEGIKVLIGKPRPDLLSRCDLDPTIVQNYAVGGDGNQLPEWNLLVSWTACRQSDRSKLDDGFQSFPSGHSSFSWAGMVYLALYVCSKFAISIPYLLPFRFSGNTSLSIFEPKSYQDKEDKTTSAKIPGSGDDASFTPSLRNQGAAPPAYLFVLPIIPIATATYIAGTRFSDFRHHGFDIIFGALMGGLFSFTSFRMYHLPIRRGAGWSWGPRAAPKAWWTGVGVANYAQEISHWKKHDIEAVNALNGNEGKFGPSGSAAASST